MLEAALLLSFLLLATGAAAVSISAQRVYERFRERYPEEAGRLFSSPGTRDPRKFLFIFETQHEPLLRADPVLWRLRAQLRVLLVCWVVGSAVQFAVFAAIALYLGLSS